MKKQLYLFLTLILTLSASAQTYNWQWAKYGGGNNGSFSAGFTFADDESIRDIAVDNQNNYYYLATINPGSPTLNGNTVNNYGRQDLFLFSTDCQGNIRWTRSIGGTNSGQRAWNIELDNNGGLYTIGDFTSTAFSSMPADVPLHFDDTNTIPVINVANTDNTTTDPGFKTSYLVKYNTSNGNLTWKQPLQGDVNQNLRLADTSIMYMDSSKNIHAIVGFLAGTHLNGLITVPSTGANIPQYYLIKFIYDNSTGFMSPTTPLLLPITGNISIGMNEGKVNLVYDETLNRYYLAGKRMFGGSGSYADFSYAGTAFTKEGYLLCFDGATGNENWRREIDNTAPTPFNFIDSIIKDGTGNIYIGGRYNVHIINNVRQPVTFNKPSNQANPIFSFPNTGGNNPFVMKLNSNGDVLWNTIATGYSSSATSNGYGFNNASLVLNGNELAFVKGAVGDIWGNFPMVRPANDNADPLLVRLNKDTGVVLGTNEVLSSYGTKDEFTAVAVDVDGNYVVGGFKHSSIFVDPNDGVPTVDGNTTSGKSQFFFAKLATSATCTQLATEEISVKETDLQFFPNPVEDVLTIKTKENLKSYELISSTGQMVKKGDFVRNNYTVNMQQLVKGVYYVKVHTEKISVIQKIIKK